MIANITRGLKVNKMGSQARPKMMLVFILAAIAGRGEAKKACRKCLKVFEEEIKDVRSQLLDYGKRLEELEKEPPKPQASNCDDLYKADSSLPSGIYTIQLHEGKDISVYCDMTTDRGGWLVFQRRQDGSENFFRGWEEYAEGFGKLDGEFWLGNKLIAAMTKDKSYELRVDLEDFENNKVFAKYSQFSVDGDKSYKLSLGSYSGTAGDSLTLQNQMKFTTSDTDNDMYSGSCASLYKGGWWYNKCHNSNLNGLYLHGKHSSYANGVNWYHFKGYYYSLKFTEMKIRPV